jgi:hypothetical protein
MKQKQHVTISEKNDCVILGLFIVCISGMIIFSIYYSPFFKKHGGSHPDPHPGHRLSSSSYSFGSISDITDRQTIFSSE